MAISRRALLGATMAGLPRWSSAQQKAPIRIGVLGDMNGPYADFGGPGSVAAARLAAEEFGSVLGRPVEIVAADHQNKPAIAASIAQGWIDTNDVVAVVECATSGAALALQQVLRDKRRIFLITVAGSSDLTNRACSPVGFHFNCDTYALARGPARALTMQGDNTWFFITVDYAFGHALERDAARFVAEAGGKVLGTIRHPLGTSDFSSYLVAARASGAKVIAFANAGQDAQNAIKQAAEFGIGRRGERLTALLLFITDVRAVGLELAQGLVLSNSFYWDLNDATRAWTKRFQQAFKPVPPTMNQAAGYASVRHCLRAIQQTGSTEAQAVAAAMRNLPVNDMYNDNVAIRADGRVLSKMYLMQVKAPGKSAYRDDDYEVVLATPGAEVFRPVAESECSLMRT